MPDSPLLARFLRYVRIDTQSNRDSQTSPSTQGQWVLLRLLESELLELGARDVTLTEFGYVLATLPATSGRADVPTVAFLAHVDTAPDFAGQNVKPLVHRKWNGKPLPLPEDPARVLDPATSLELRSAKGKDIVTASGRTLLGADDKAGVAVLMQLAAHLLKHPELKHGPIRVCFTPDEEIGRGVDKLDLDQLGANVAYTLDGENPGEVVWETFSADRATLVIEGVSTHPGEGKKRGMVNSLHLAAKLLAALPREFVAPETTEDRQGYIHPERIEGKVDRTEIRFILRDHDQEGLQDKGRRLKALADAFQVLEPRARLSLKLQPEYRNMGYWLKKDMTPVDLAYEAVRRLDLEPTSPPARGGTDGSRLTERGLPTPNLFCGYHNAHGPLEWVAVQDMELAMRMCLELAQLWEQKAAGYKGYSVRKRRPPTR
jgi:tripeptide aminopeptidase